MLSSSLLWSVGSLAISSLVAPALATGNAKQSYQLQDDWHGKKFFDYFEFFDQPDPTNGFVTYVNQSYAQSSGLVDITESGSLYMGVDYQTKLSPTGPGRESVRIESKEFYREGLYIIDIKHMPGGVCGTWPAFWSVGPSWPEDGEIDIIEGVNKHDSNKIVLHTSGSCDVGGEHDMTGSLTSGECGEASGTIGCVVEGQKGSSGDPFNSQGGGVYAMEWTPEFIKIWFLPRSSIPKSLEKGHPDTAEFGTPMAHLQGTCNFHERFTAQKFILNTAFCGDWAGGVFGDSGCPVSDPSNPMQSCVNFVAENPAAFKDAYWEINSIKRFELGTSKPEKPETTSVVQVASTSTANGAAVTSIKSATSVSTSKDGKATSMTQVIEKTSVAETQRTEAPVVPSNTADVEPTKVPQHTEGPKHTDTPSGGSGAGSGSNNDQDQDEDQDDGDDEEPQRSTVWITSTSTYCPKTKGGSIATAPPVPAKPSTEVAVAVPSAPGTSQAEDKTVPVVVPTAPAATEPAPKPTGVSPEGQTPEGKTPGSKHPEDEAPEGSSSQSSIEVKPPPTAATSIPVDSTRPVLPSGTPSSSGFVPVPTYAGGVPHGTTGSAPSATTPSSPVFTGAASSLSIGLTGVMGALAIALFA